ncbi:spore coat protein [Oceanobacillus alkalisoli]|uniref:spore coat protein n=1 Tax=Oceanobacillus alkalisoli TaxID=2925113 RepID=UPI001EF12BC0|nr:spore coat protein [Oceanobacillus alkalisoli]MCF3941957.1 spore coat protein [Oceanobacillus alkalisoli]MCG5102090.1 spore coat protein [Oceanobacillus alkalisoli]
MRHQHGRHCGCQACKTIIYPTKHNCVNQFSESTVNHVHPSHTTVMNHHLQKNKHFYPHSTSVQNTWNSVNEFGGAFETPSGPGGQVAGAYSPPGGPGGMGPGGMGMGPGAGPGQVMGATQPGCGMHHGNHWKKPGKWC